MKKIRLSHIHLVMLGLIMGGLLALCYLLFSSKLLYLLLVLLATACFVALLFYQKKSYEMTEQEQMALLNDTTEANLVTLLENMPVGVVQLNASEDKIIWFNPYSALQLAHQDGRFNEEVVFRHLADRRQGLPSNTLVLGRKKFSVSFDEGHHMLYFWDTYSPAFEQGVMTDFSPVIAVVSVDNYDDLTDNLSDAEQSQVNSFIASFIADFAQSKKIFYRRADKDRFYLFTDYFVLNELIADKFSVLDKFREEAKENGLALTLSMGISYGNHDHQDIGQVAQASLNMAMVRGGDQIVIKENAPHKEFQYFGGGTTSTVKRSRTRTRAMMTAISDKIRMADAVFVVGHRNLDMDALGASVGMQFFASKLVDKAYAVYDEVQLADDVARAIEHLTADQQDSVISLQAAFEKLIPNSLLIMVDHSKVSLTLSEEFYRRFSDVIVIDHHRRDDDFPENASLSFIESGASSASELVTELIQFQNMSPTISNHQASVLMAGIMLDTKNFSTRVTSRTFDVASYLRRRGSNPDDIQMMAAQNFDDYRLVNRLVMAGQVVANNMIVAMGEEDVAYSNVIASKAADTLLSMSGIEASFVVTRNPKGQAAISARSKQKINVQRLMEKLGGGGHFNLAACQVNGTSVSQLTRALLQEIAEEIKIEEES